jgi:type II secretory pathway pseudopilin PulG
MSHPLIKRSRRGISLVELILAIAIVVAVGVALSTQFSTVSRHVLQNRQRLYAINLANTQLQTLNGQTYAWLNTTDSLTSTLPNCSIAPPCDCSTTDLSTLNNCSVAMSSAAVAGTTFTTIYCVNYVKRGITNNWIPQCDSLGDTNIKNIVVQVSWTSGSSSSTVTRQSLLIHE